MMKRWQWILLIGGSVATVIGAFTLGARASDDLPPLPDPPPAPPTDGGVGTGSAYGVSLATWASKQASQLPQYRRYFWSWKRLLTDVEPPGGCTGPLTLVDQAQGVADAISKSPDSPDADLYASALWLFATMNQLQSFKTTRVAVFGTCQWAP